MQKEGFIPFSVLGSNDLGRAKQKCQQLPSKVDSSSRRGKGKRRKTENGQVLNSEIPVDLQVEYERFLGIIP